MVERDVARIDRSHDVLDGRLFEREIAQAFRQVLPDNRSRLLESDVLVVAVLSLDARFYGYKRNGKGLLQASCLVFVNLFCE